MMRGRFAVLRSNQHIYFIPSYFVVYFISLDSQKNRLLGYSIYINIGNIDSEMKDPEIWKLIFSL